MKTFILFLTLVSLKAVGQADDEFGVTINRTVTLDSSTYKSLIQRATPVSSTNTDLSFVADKYVNDIMDDFTYWNAFYSGHQTTLYVFPNPKSSSDSILVAENSNNKFVFKKLGNKWLMDNFTIKVSNFTLNHVACGQTSKEALKLIGKKIKHPVNNGQVLISNKTGTYRFVLTFVNDKLTSIQL